MDVTDEFAIQPMSMPSAYIILAVIAGLLFAVIGRSAERQCWQFGIGELMRLVVFASILFALVGRFGSDGALLFAILFAAYLLNVGLWRRAYHLVAASGVILLCLLSPGLAALTCVGCVLYYAVGGAMLLFDWIGERYAGR